MSIADGEYEIDLSAFLGKDHVSGQENSLGIRYGFIPDSMDQTSPLTLYQTDQESLIRAKTMESSGSNVIIFEGNPKRLGPSKNPANETYFLTVSPEGENQVVLKKLNSTIRVSKSRNVAKWERKMETWDKESNSRQSSNIYIPEIDERPSQTNDVKPAKASKRPPVANSKIKSNEVIIDSDEESGFIDDGMNDSEFPDIHFDVTPQEAKITKKPSTSQTSVQSTSKIRSAIKPGEDDNQKASSKLPSKPEPKSGLKPVLNPGTKPKPKMNVESSTKTVPQASSKTNVKDMKPVNPQDNNSDLDIDDDFKDLEDQLREVLEEDGQVVNKPQTTVVDDDDDDESDADDYHFPSLAPIKINFEEGNLSKDSRPSLNKSFSGNSQSKPMSLKDLVGNRRKVDEDPSSEEE